jgi:RNA polymerase sigma factor (TIGR02999 family)
MMMFSHVVVVALSLTERLNLFMQGDVAVAESLLQEILPTLHEIAARELRREYGAVPLTKTELIHELWLSNLRQSDWKVVNRGHFFALASRAMRRILVDEARKRLSLKRGRQHASLPLDEDKPCLTPSVESDAERIVEIGMLVERLEAKHPDPARVIEMHYFGGFGFDEIAQATGLTLKQVRSRWNKGLRFLKRSLGAL